MPNFEDLDKFWEWKRRMLIDRLVRRQMHWNSFEAEFARLKAKMHNDLPCLQSYDFSDYVYWKMKGKPSLCEIVLPESEHVQEYYENVVMGSRYQGVEEDASLQ